MSGQQDAVRRQPNSFTLDINPLVNLAYIRSQQGVIDNWKNAAAIAEQRMDSLVTEAHALADRKGYCSDFDDFMEELGLPTRVKDYSVRVDVSIYVPASGRDENEALSNIGSYEVKEALDELDRRFLNFDIIEAEEVG